MLNILAKVFGLIVKKRYLYYQKHPEKVIQCKIPVISIGNISLGGSGKTPFCQFLANKLMSKGIRTAIIGRGYRRKSKGLVVVSDGNKVVTDIYNAGDEMLLLAKTTKSPVIVSEKKSNSAIFASTNFDLDCIIVDDGFQHLQLHRDIDIVLVDNDTIAKPDLIPKGKLREPFESLSRADFVCYYDDEAKIKLSKHNNNLLKLIVRYLNPFNIFNNKEELIKKLKDDQERILLLSGIAKPFRFQESMNNLNLNLVHHISYPDHFQYERDDIMNIIAYSNQFESKIVLTTEKDAVKIINYEQLFISNKINVLAIPLELSISDLDFEVIKSQLINKIHKVYNDK